MQPYLAGLDVLVICCWLAVFASLVVRHRLPLTAAETAAAQRFLAWLRST